MTKPVRLKDVVDAFEYPEEWEVYLNRKTGEIFWVPEDHSLSLDDVDSGDDDAQDLPEWQEDDLPQLKANLDALRAGDCVALPSSFDIHEWDIMRRFAESIRDKRKREQVVHAIHGSGAFRYFKDTVHRLALADEWYEYRNHALEQIAVDWLESEQIPFTRD